MEIAMTTVSIPQPGSQIEIDVADPIAPRQIPPGPDQRTLRGEVIPGYRWLTDREFCMTGDRDWPVRVINIANVRKIRIVSGTSRTVQTDIKTYSISGSGGNHYAVTRSPAGWNCQCKGFQFRGRCRHIQEAQNQ